MLELLKALMFVLALMIILILVLSLGHSILVILGTVFLVYAIFRAYSFLNDEK